MEAEAITAKARAGSDPRAGGIPRRHTRVIGTLRFFFAVGLACFVATAPAKAAVYEGHIVGVPGTDFDLGFSKDGSGKRVIDSLYYYRMPHTCEDDAFDYFALYAWRGSRVRDGAFDRRVDKGDYHSRLTGELRRGDHVAGTYRQRDDFGPVLGVCRTGKLEWVAKKR